jgi:hypothetical protein
MSMMFGFLCLAGAIALFLKCIPKAVKESGVQRTVLLKHPRHSEPAKCCKH